MLHNLSNGLLQNATLYRKIQDAVLIPIDFGPDYFRSSINHLKCQATLTAIYGTSQTASAELKQLRRKPHLSKSRHKYFTIQFSNYEVRLRRMH